MWSFRGLQEADPFPANCPNGNYEQMEGNGMNTKFLKANLDKVLMNAKGPFLHWHAVVPKSRISVLSFPLLKHPGSICGALC